MTKYVGKFLDEKGREKEWRFDAPSEDALKAHLDKIEWKIISLEENGAMIEQTQTATIENTDMVNQKDKDIRHWHYEMKGQRKGPVSTNEIRKLLSLGTLTRDSLVWHNELSDWVPVSQSDLIKGTAEPPPLTGLAVNNTIVWWLAFAPLIGYLLIGIIAELYGTVIGGRPEWLDWVVFIGLNCGLALLDEATLKKAGYDPAKLGMGAVFLIPVYLFKRAKVLKQSNAYFVVWCIAFGLSLLCAIADGT